MHAKKSEGDRGWKDVSTSQDWAKLMRSPKIQNHPDSPDYVYLARCSMSVSVLLWNNGRGWREINVSLGYVFLVYLLSLTAVVISPFEKQENKQQLLSGKEHMKVWPNCDIHQQGADCYCRLTEHRLCHSEHTQDEMMVNISINVIYIWDDNTYDLV